MSTEERIYVGGMDPNRLSVQEVLDRVRRHFEGSGYCNQWSLHNVHVGSCYFQATVSRQEEDQTTKSALEEAKSLLHNVKWKGCKLRVEPACLNFLDRLAQEREERKKRKRPVSTTHDHPLPEGEATIQGDVNTSPTHDDRSSVNRSSQSAPPQQQRRRRHYKIRRGYGETVWHVDTKPYQVSDYASFCKLRKKLQRRQQHYDQKLATAVAQSSKKQALSSNTLEQIRTAKRAGTRAIHWRHVVPTQETEDKESLIITKESAPNQAEGTPPTLVEEANVVGESEEDPSDSSGEESSEHGSSSHSKANNVQDSPPRSLDVDASSESEDETEDRAESGAEKDETTQKQDKYVWSTDEDSSEDDEDYDATERMELDSNRPTKNLLKEKWNAMDEFDGGGTSNIAPSTLTSQSEEQTTDMAQEDWDLDKEDKSHRNVLAQLFPDLENELQQKRRNAASEASRPRTGWAATGEMLRFDPTKQSSQQFIMVDEDEGNNGTTMSSSSPTGLQDGEEEEEEEESLTGINGDDQPNHDSKDAMEETIPEDHGDNKAIYRQGELEAVFREAREEDAAVVVLESAAAAADAAPGGFSFAFNLGPSDDLAQKSVNADTQEFSIPVPGVEATDSKSSTAMDGGTTDSPKAATVSRKRHFSTGFSKEELDQYVRAFYEFDDGKRMLRDLEGYRKDPAVQESWDEKRRTLTLDWKRKRKAAISKRRANHHARGGASHS